MHLCCFSAGRTVLQVLQVRFCQQRSLMITHVARRARMFGFAAIDFILVDGFETYVQHLVFYARCFDGFVETMFGERL